MENSRRCEISQVIIHKASYAKHLRSKRHLGNEKEEWLFQKPIEIKVKKTYKTKPLKRISGENIELDDKQVNEELAEKMVKIFHFTHRALKVGPKITLESLQIDHPNSKICIKPNFPEFGIEFQFLIKC